MLRMSKSIVVNVTIFKMKIISYVNFVTKCNQLYVAVWLVVVGFWLVPYILFIQHLVWLMPFGIIARANGITESKMDLRIHITHEHVGYTFLSTLCVHNTFGILCKHSIISIYFKIEICVILSWITRSLSLCLSFTLCSFICVCIIISVVQKQFPSHPSTLFTGKYSTISFSYNFSQLCLLFISLYPPKNIFSLIHTKTIAEIRNFTFKS